MIPYPVIRSDRRTVCIEISRDGTVKVRAPRKMPDREIEAFIADKQGWIEKHLAARKPARPNPTAEEIEALRRRAKAEIPPRVDHYAALMGLTPTSVKITAARKRFGSCSGKNGLCFSLFLMQYPPEAIDYVVVHELAHIKHKNHSPAFHSLIARYLPDHKARRAMLKK
jgi:predicted metal-dependent hydrolase